MPPAMRSAEVPRSRPFSLLGGTEARPVIAEAPRPSCGSSAFFGTTSAVRAARIASVALAAPLALALLAARAAAVESDIEDEFVSSRAARERLRELPRERAGTFVGIALGSVVGIAAAISLHVLWKKRALAARTSSGALLALATARLLGELVLGSSVQSLAATGIAWVFLAGALASVFRTPPARPPTCLVATPRSAGRRPTHRRAQEAEVSTHTPENAPTEDRSPREPATRAIEEALSHIERGDVDAAIAALGAQIASCETKRARMYLGTILGARGELEAALRELDRALELDPDYSEALSEKARVLEELGRTEEALAVREKLRSSRARRTRSPRRASGLVSCPACGKTVTADSERCGCGLPLRKCSSCGSEGVELRPREGRLVCTKCRAREAAAHAKAGALVERARAAREVPPWVTAAAFAGAVAVGAAASPLHVAWRERSASLAARELLAEATSALERSDAGEAPSAQELDGLESRATATLAANPFARDRAATLRMLLALHGLRAGVELARRGEDEAARFAWGWGLRQAAQGLAALDARDRERMPRGLSRTFADMRDAFERDLEERQRRAAAIAQSSVGLGVPVSRRDWRSVWVRPEPGTSFFVEVFRRASLTAPQEAIVGTHKDGSPVTAVRLLKCIVASGEGLPLLVEPVAFEVRKLDAAPEGLAPEVRLVPREGASAEVSAGETPPGRRGPWRLEFSDSLRFRSLADLSAGSAELVATAESIYASRETPARELPIFAPGLDESWAQDETLLWPYGSASPERGPCVKQIARWLTGPDGRERVSVAWLLRYEPATKRYVERIVQSWTAGRIWWDFYDDELTFFRTVFPERPGGGEGPR